MEQVVPDRQGARIGAFVSLATPIDHASFQQVSARCYHGEYTISVDDAQFPNPRYEAEVCPEWKGYSRYCRGWNIRGHHDLHLRCPYLHPEEERATYMAEYSLQPLPDAKLEELQCMLQRFNLQPLDFVDGDRPSKAKVVKAHTIRNATLEELYMMRRASLREMHGDSVLEVELWHGTNCKAIEDLLQHGLHPPADSEPSTSCPISGGKDMHTTLCGTSCELCHRPHKWKRCHMYGLGVYLADIAAKSHAYVRPKGNIYSLLRCRVCLGNPFCIETDKLHRDSLHDFCRCQDPTADIVNGSQQWVPWATYDSFVVRGSPRARQGFGAHCNEYIVFHPYQILPLYCVDYSFA